MLNKAIKKAKENKKGFTLAELLIVVAIIAVLVAISIPIFTSQLEKSRDAVDAANVRSAYAEASAAYLTGDYNTTAKAYKVTPKQKTEGWQTSFDFPADLKVGETAATKIKSGTDVVLTWTEADGPKISVKLAAEE